MSQLIILKNIYVENANAIAGFTYGFPAITHFLGFTHALSRRTEKAKGVTLQRCAVIAHNHQIHAFRSTNWSDYTFSQTRNPLLKNGATAPIIEEGRMHMQISLIIEAHGLPEENDAQLSNFLAYFNRLALQQKLAGGRIINIDRCYTTKMPNPENTRKMLRPFLPGFLLADRTGYFRSHYETNAGSATMLDAWLDYASLQYECLCTTEDEVVWKQVQKPHKGYLIPITVGYKRIAPLYAAGTVEKVRDVSVPFSFVEAVFSVGEWLTPARVASMDEVLWHYHYDDPYYVCACINSTNDSNSEF